MKTIIFDFDGTIADTFKMSIEIAHKLTGQQTLLDHDEIKALKKGTMVEVAEKLGIPKYKWPFLIFRGRREMSKRLKEIKPFDGMDDILAELHKRGYRVFVMSTNSNRNISRFLSAHGMRKDVRKIYGGVGLLNKAGALRKILKKNKIKPTEAIYVGDEVRDVEAAKSVDMKIVAITWGFNDTERLLAENPNHLVRTRPDLLKILKSWEVNKDMV